MLGWGSSSPARSRAASRPRSGRLDGHIVERIALELLDELADAAVRFNRPPTDGIVAHRERMTLIVHMPAMRAHASLRWAEWREVVARFAARRLDEPVDALGPQLVGHLALGAGLAGYEEWLRDEGSDLQEVMARAFGMLDDAFRPAAVAR